MNKLSLQKRAQIIGLLVEGNSMRSVTRLVGCSINTVTKLLVDAGTACAIYQNEVMRDLPCKRIQCDEIWAFCGMKERNVPKEHEGELGYGDVYTWTAICADTKLVPSFLIGRRDAEYAYTFMHDLAGRLKNRVQLTTDGHHVYLNAVASNFGSEIDYAMLVKVYGATVGKEDQRRYSPPECTGAEKRRINGNPDIKHVSTSFVERQNLTMRMGMRRFTRLTCIQQEDRQPGVRGCTALLVLQLREGSQDAAGYSAMEAGISDHVWTLEEIAELSN